MQQTTPSDRVVIDRELVTGSDSDVSIEAQTYNIFEHAVSILGRSVIAHGVGCECRITACVGTMRRISESEFVYDDSNDLYVEAHSVRQELGEIDEIAKPGDTLTINIIVGDSVFRKETEPVES